MSKLSLDLVGETQIVVTRRFSAPPDKVYRAHTEPELIRQWMLGPEGWTMPICECDPRVGGTFRFGWTNGEGASFTLTGEYVELASPGLIVHVERMHMPETTPDTRVETRFEPDGDGTVMTVTMSAPDAETRAAMLATGMEHGMEASYARLEAYVLTG